MYQGDGIDCIADPCPPVPAPAARGTSSADRAVEVSVVPSQRQVLPGATLKVHVLVSGVTDLRAYELSVAVVGGTHGRFDPVDMAIDSSRSDYVFGDVQSFHAVDRRQTRMANAVIASGSSSPSGNGYLGSFVFRASPDAKGTFRIELQGDQGVYLLDSNGRSIDAKLGTARVTVQSRSTPGLRIER